MILLTIMLCLNSVATSISGREGNGGQGVALEFQLSAQMAINIAKFYPKDFHPIKFSKLSKILNKTEIHIVKYPLILNFKGTLREVTAINTKNPNQIYINQNQWNSISEFSTKQALALHELLGLAGLESTGDYSYSQKFLRLLGIKCHTQLCNTHNAYQAMASKQWSEDPAPYMVTECHPHVIAALEERTIEDALNRCLISHDFCEIKSTRLICNGLLDSNCHLPAHKSDLGEINIGCVVISEAHPI